MFCSFFTWGCFMTFVSCVCGLIDCGWFVFLPECLVFVMYVGLMLFAITCAFVWLLLVCLFDLYCFCLYGCTLHRLWCLRLVACVGLINCFVVCFVLLLVIRRLCCLFWCSWLFATVLLLDWLFVVLLGLFVTLFAG